MAAMAVANYKRRVAQMELQTSNRHQIFNFNDQQQSTPPVGFTSTFAPDFAKDANHTSGTQKWSCDADGVTINTKWFPSSTSGLVLLLVLELSIYYSKFAKYKGIAAVACAVIV